MLLCKSPLLADGAFIKIFLSNRTPKRITQHGTLKVLVCFLVIVVCGFVAEAQVSFQTKTFKLSFTAAGRLVEALALPANKSYLPAKETSYLLSVKRDGKIIHPERMEWKKKSSEINLFFPDKNSAVIKQTKMPPM